MKVPDFRGITVYNEADGRGIIERVYVGGGIVFAIKFDNNNISRKFRIPRAFTSGFLTTENKDLQDYVKSLPDIETHPNDDLPSVKSLNMVLTNKYALDSYRLAILGALDDFYQLYIDVYNLAVQHMIEYTSKELERIHQESRGQLYFDFPKSIKSKVMKLFEPVLNKYLYIFTNEYHEIFAHSYAFSHFEFFPFGNGGLRRRKTFREFCTSIEDIYIDAFYKWKGESSRESVAKLVNDRIQILAYLKEKERLLSIESMNAQQDTDEPLYMIDALSSTICYKEKHPVEPKSYIASLVDKSGRVILPTHYCPVCNRYFIGSKTLNEYEKIYGKMLIMKRKCSEAIDKENTFEGFNVESPLHQYGYNVRADGLSELERQKLLVSLIETKRLTYLEICRTIEQSINLLQNSPQYAQAVLKWRKDLKFIGDYINTNF